MTDDHLTKAFDPGAMTVSGPSRRHLIRLLAAATALPVLPRRLAAQSAAAQPAAARPAGLPLPPSDGTVDILHGVHVEDPFRPLEDLARADVRRWIEAEDALARHALESDPLHAAVSDFLRGTLRYRRAFEHRRVGNRFTARVHDGVREQSWLEISESADGPGRALIDPNDLGPNGSVSLGSIFPDRMARRIAFLTTENGGDAQTLRVIDARTGDVLGDRIEGCRFTTVVWLPDGNAFYYVRPPLPSEPVQHDRTSHQLYLHRLGTPQASDELVFRFPRLANVAMALRVNYAANHLMVLARIGTDEKAGLWIAPLRDARQMTQLIPMGQSSFSLIHAIGITLYAITDLDAPRRRIVRVLQTDPQPSAWQTIVPESEGVIDGATLIANRMLVRQIRDLGHHLSIHDLDGQKLMDVVLGERLRIGFERSERSGSEIRIDVEDRRRPLRQVRLSVTSGHAEVLPAPRPPHTLEDAVVRDVFARSEDGTTVPVTLIHLPGVEADGTNRVLLYGYGSYGLAQLPRYSAQIAAWVRLGGVYAIATIRGGSEYGRDWHENGRRGQKRNAVSDFIAAAERLVELGLTRPAHLGIHGSSSGGRLVLGAMVRRPDLFGAVVAGVPLVDMLRFHLHTFGIAWKQEYGDPENPDDFRALLALSPLHNVAEGVVYPPLLLLTADNDQRVVPSHAYKMAATLRRRSPKSEVLVRTRRGAGHGVGNSLSKSIEFQADVITFLTSRLGGRTRELPKL